MIGACIVASHFYDMGASDNELAEELAFLMPDATYMRDYMSFLQAKHLCQGHCMPSNLVSSPHMLCEPVWEQEMQAPYDTDVEPLDW